MEIGLTYYGDHDAFYLLDRAAQVRVLGWWRARSLGGPACVREHCTPRAAAPANGKSKAARLAAMGFAVS